MHWDSSVSLGNIVSLIALLGAMVVGFNVFVTRHNTAIALITAAINNLSAVTDRLEKAVQVQNGRLVKVETVLAVREEVDRRMSALGHPQA